MKVKALYEALSKVHHYFQILMKKALDKNHGI